MNGKKSKKQTARGRSQDRARIAGGETYELSHESGKTGKSASEAVKKVGTSRKRVERRLGAAKVVRNTLAVRPAWPGCRKL
ncbi:hypothetical protein XH92_15090 [Bradyrhizobium sp. CCBAU 53421]|nr:hypothetical protein XH92_15090 [Bradyrhizobium sp. CCBAU 53421]